MYPSHSSNTVVLRRGQVLVVGGRGVRVVLGLLLRRGGRLLRGQGGEVVGVVRVRGRGVRQVALHLHRLLLRPCSRGRTRRHAVPHLRLLMLRRGRRAQSGHRGVRKAARRRRGGRAGLRELLLVWGGGLGLVFASMWTRFR